MGSRVFIGGLTYRVRERDVECFFRKYGRVKDVAMKCGFAFVEFHDYRDAEDAILGLNGKELLGERVSVEKARGTPHGSDRWLVSGGDGSDMRRDRSRDSYDKYSSLNRTNYRLIVENLSSRINWKDLKNCMRLAGEVTYANAHNRRLNEGIVEFASYAHMKSAIEMYNNTEMNGRQIRLVESYDRGGKNSGRDFSRSRSGSPRSGSRSRSKQHSHSHSQDRSPQRSSSKLC